MNAQKITVKFPEPMRSWNAVINFVENKISAGHSLPWSIKPTLGTVTPFGVIPPGIGLHDSNGHLTLRCNDFESATVLVRKINAEFGD